MMEPPVRRENIEHPLEHEVEDRGIDASRPAPDVDLFTEREFADSGRDGNEPESAHEKTFEDVLKDFEPKESMSGPTQATRQVKKQNPGGRIRLFILILMGLSLLMAFGYFHLKYNLFSSNTKEIESVPEKRHFPILKEETIAFDSFIVPFRENKRFTYISLSIVFSLPNKEISREMSRKRDYIRGILYDMFTEEINRANNIPPIDHLKASIIRTVNRTLSTGVVKEVFITQFLAV